MNWPVVALGDEVKFIGGSQPPKTTFISEEREGYIRMLQIRDYKTDRFKTYIPIGKARRFCTKEEIMIGRYGPPVFQILRGLEGAYNVALMKAEPSNKVDRDYLYHFLKQEKLFNLIDRLSQRTAGQSGVDMDALKRYPMYLPPLNEQKRIAEILDKADAIRRKRQQAIDLTDQLLRSVFLDMFGDPVTNPKGIKIAPMTDVFDITTGKLNSNATVEGGEYPFFTCAKQAFEIDTYAFDQEALLLAGNNAQAVYDVKYYIGKFNAYQRTYVLTLKDEKWSYPFYQFALEYQLENLKRFSKGSNTKYITMEIMGRTMLPLPHSDEQLEFVRRVETARSLIHTYNKHMELTEANFQSLTQQAFNGELSKQTKAA